MSQSNTAHSNPYIQHGPAHSNQIGLNIVQYFTDFVFAVFENAGNPAKKLEKECGSLHGFEAISKISKTQL